MKCPQCGKEWGDKPPYICSGPRTDGSKCGYKPSAAEVAPPASRSSPAATVAPKAAPATSRYPEAPSLARRHSRNTVAVAEVPVGFEHDVRRRRARGGGRWPGGTHVPGTEPDPFEGGGGRVPRTSPKADGEEKREPAVRTPEAKTASPGEEAKELAAQAKKLADEAQDLLAKVDPAALGGEAQVKNFKTSVDRLRDKADVARLESFVDKLKGMPVKPAADGPPPTTAPSGEPKSTAKAPESKDLATAEKAMKLAGKGQDLLGKMDPAALGGAEKVAKFKGQIDTLAKTSDVVTLTALVRKFQGMVPKPPAGEALPTTAPSGEAKSTAKTPESKELSPAEKAKELAGQAQKLLTTVDPAALGGEVKVKNIKTSVDTLRDRADVGKLEQLVDKLKGMPVKPAAGEPPPGTASPPKTAEKGAAREKSGRPKPPDEQILDLTTSKQEQQALVQLVKGRPQVGQGVLDALALFHEGAKAAPGDAQLEARTRKTRLLNAARFGALSRSSPDPKDVEGLSDGEKAQRKDLARRRDEATAALLADMKDNPDLAFEALEVVQDCEHPEAFAGGVGKLKALAASNFGGQAKLPREAAGMRRNALKMAGLVGGTDYFVRMEKFYADPNNLKPDPNRVEDTEQTTLNYTGAMGRALVDLKPDASALNGLRDRLHFHPDNLKDPMATLAVRVETFLGQLRDATTQKECRQALSGVKPPPPDSAQEKLIQRTPGVKGAPSADDGRTAILSGMLTPLTQGKVGSCFATCNCMDFQDKKPVELIEDLARMVNTGCLAKPGLDAVPIVGNVPKNENGLLRSWEYTVATLGAKQNQQYEGVPDQRLRRRVRDLPRNARVREAAGPRQEPSRGATNLRGGVQPRPGRV